MNDVELTVVVIGLLLILMALLVEIEHKVIWTRHKKHYHAHKNKTLDMLLRPNKTVYYLNVYVVWPLVLLLGIVIVFQNI